MSRFASTVLTALGLILLPPTVGGLAAQEATPDTSTTLDVSADGSLAVQRLGGGSLVSLGGRLWLGLPAGWRLGFGAAWGLNRIDGGELEGSGLEATFGMGGATVAAPLPTLFDMAGLEAMLTLGSGSVTLDNALVGTTVDREAVWIVQPGVFWDGRRLGPFSAGVEVGYRFVLGADGLSRLEAGDLRTFTLAGVLSLPPS